MTLHLVKLCVGVGAVEELEGWIAERLDACSKAGEPFEQVHVTRMVPTRKDQLLAGGSLFWVIKGHIQVRQRLLAIEPFQDKDGVRRCRLRLDPVLFLTAWQPR